MPFPPHNWRKKIETKKMVYIHKKSIKKRKKKKKIEKKN